MLSVTPISIQSHQFNFPSEAPSKDAKRHFPSRITPSDVSREFQGNTGLWFFNDEVSPNPTEESLGHSIRKPKFKARLPAIMVRTRPDANPTEPESLTNFLKDPQMSVRNVHVDSKAMITGGFWFAQGGNGDSSLPVK